MAIVAHAEGDDIEAWGLGSLEAEGAAEVVFILGGGDLGLELAVDAVDLLGAEVDVVEEGFAGHAVVAVGVVGGDGAFVNEEEFEFGPRHALEEGVVGVGEQAKEALGVLPPEMAMRTRPRAAAASSASSTKWVAARQARAA